MRSLAFSFTLIVVLIIGTSAQAAWRGFAVTDVNLRDGPGTGYPVVDVVPEGARVFVDYCEGRWCAVNYRGEEGWLARRLLEQTRVRDYAPPREIYPPLYEDDYYDAPDYREVIVVDPPRVRPPRRFRHHRANRRNERIRLRKARRRAERRVERGNEVVRRRARNTERKHAQRVPRRLRSEPRIAEHGRGMYQEAPRPGILLKPAFDIEGNRK